MMAMDAREVFVGHGVQVRVFHRETGLLMRAWGCMGEAPGQFTRIGGIAVLEGRVWVTSCERYWGGIGWGQRLQQFRKDGSFISLRQWLDIAGEAVAPLCAHRNRLFLGLPNKVCAFTAHLRKLFSAPCFPATHLAANDEELYVECRQHNAASICVLGVGDGVHLRHILFASPLSGIALCDGMLYVNFMNPSAGKGFVHMMSMDFKPQEDFPSFPSVDALRDLHATEEGVFGLTDDYRFVRV